MCTVLEFGVGDGEKACDYACGVILAFSFFFPVTTQSLNLAEADLLWHLVVDAFPTKGRG